MLQRRPAQFLPPAGTRARIGLFGGSFDPPHRGHIHVAKTALKRLQLDQVWWFPTPGNPLKEPPSAYSARVEAVQALIAPHKAFRLSTVEQALQLRYTRDLVQVLRRHCPRAQLIWIMGGDSLMTFHYWKDWEDIAYTVPIAAVARPGFERAALSSPFARIFAARRVAASAAPAVLVRTRPAWTYISAPLDPISSTALRQG